MSERETERECESDRVRDKVRGERERALGSESGRGRVREEGNTENKQEQSYPRFQCRI